MGLRDEFGEIDRELESILESTKNMKSEDDAYGLFASLIATASRISNLVTPSGGRPSSIQTQPAIQPSGPISSLQSWIQKIKSALEALATFLKASSYSVGVTVPFGLQIQISFSL